MASGKRVTPRWSHCGDVALAASGKAGKPARAAAAPETKEDVKCEEA